MKRAYKIGLAALVAGGILILLAWVVEMRLGPGGLPLAGQTAAPGGKLPVISTVMPPISGVAEWINSGPLTAADLKGKVVLVDFWTYSCVNCLRELPVVVMWDEKYRADGLVVIGVHTPEFAFEKDPANVRAAVDRLGIKFPVAMDNDYATWNSFGNSYWPAAYLFDAQGRLRLTHFGEGDYEKTEQSIRGLLAEAGAKPSQPAASITPTADFGKIGTPETYIGYVREDALSSPELLLQDKPQRYSVPTMPAMNDLYLGGVWQVGPEFATLADAPGEVVIRYSASNANLVMGAPQPVRAEVLLDGQPVPAAARGSDLIEAGGRTYADVGGYKMYDLIDAKGNYGDHVLRVVFPTAGVQTYVFTFG